MEIVMKKMKKKTQRFPQPLVPTFLGVEVSSEFKQKLRTPLMNSLLLEARILKTSGALINVPVDDHILHLDQYTALISYEELIHWCDEGEIGVSHISIFMRYLSDLTDTLKSTVLYGFLFPETLSKFAAVSEEYRSDYIARAMTCRECGRGRKLIFAPYHEGDHWMLGAISPSDSTVYWCDPAGYMEPRQFFVETITRAFEKRNSIDPLVGFKAKPLTWKIIKDNNRNEEGTVQGEDKLQGDNQGDNHLVVGTLKVDMTDVNDCDDDEKAGTQMEEGTHHDDCIVLLHTPSDLTLDLCL
ncbi:uncharacterized protein LOC141632690 [Silene latifolia]|uniref:uncharacterized protein LOC141632690 n=1 Tax=Silene latifolia TaxID=37657 RepID=UPI003D776479